MSGAGLSGECRKWECGLLLVLREEHRGSCSLAFGWCPKIMILDGNAGGHKVTEPVLIYPMDV